MIASSINPDEDVKHRDEAWNISARSSLEEIQAAARRAAPMRCVAQHSVPPSEPQM
jgi:hypothetical protein